MPQRGAVEWHIELVSFVFPVARNLAVVRPPAYCVAVWRPPPRATSRRLEAGSGRWHEAVPTGWHRTVHAVPLYRGRTAAGSS